MKAQPKSSTGALNPTTSALIRDRRENSEEEEKGLRRQRHESDAARSQGVPGATGNEEARKDSPLEPSEGAQPSRHPDFGHPASRTEREHISVVLNHQVCGPHKAAPGKRPSDSS